MSYVIAADIGESQDYTAISVIQCNSDHYFVGMVERLPLGTQFSEAVARVGAWASAYTPADIVIDSTGLGAPVVEMAVERIRGARVVGITITGGNSLGRNRHGITVPKNTLISALTASLYAGTIRLSQEIPEIQTVTAELADFRKRAGVRSTTYGNQDQPHDDTVLSLALGVFWASYTRPLKKV